jgi:ATP-binding cassette subfamily C protein CydCD
VASERPSALLARLGRASPLVRAALVVAGITSAVTTAAIVAQAIAIASVLGHLFRSSHADVAPGLAALGVATVVRVVSLVVGDVAAARSAAPVRRDLRARLVTRAVRHGYTGPADSLTQLATRGVDAVELYLSRYVPALVTSVVAPAVALTWLVVTDPLSGVIVGLSVGLLPIFMVLLGLEAKGRIAGASSSTWRGTWATSCAVWRC